MRKNGFTLIELVVVISVIGIITSITVPKFQDSIKDSKVANVQGNLTSLRTAIEVFNLANGEYPDLKEDFDSFEPFYTRGEMPTTPSSKNSFESASIFNKRNNTGGWIYDRKNGYIYANLQNGNYTGDPIEEVWQEDSEALTSTTETSFKLEGVTYDFEVDPSVFRPGAYRYRGANLGGWQTDFWGEWFGVGVFSSGTAGILASSGNTFFQLGWYLDTPIYQDITVEPGVELNWSMDHRGYSYYGDDRTDMIISYVKDGIRYNQTIETMSDNVTGWGSYNGSYTVPDDTYDIRVQLKPRYSYYYFGGNFVDNFNIEVAE